MLRCPFLGSSLVTMIDKRISQGIFSVVIMPVVTKYIDTLYFEKLYIDKH